MHEGWTFFRVGGLGGAVFCSALSCTGGTHSVSDSAHPVSDRRQDSLAAEPGRSEDGPLPGRSASRLADNDWSLATHQTVVLASQNLALSLPQGQAWQSLPRRGTWSGMGQSATESEIWVRHVVARRTVTIDECEKEARLSWPPIRVIEDGDVERVLRAPSGYGGKLSVMLLPDGGGRVEAFSVGVSRCLAFVFTTGGSPGFPERLRVVVNEVIETMRVPDVDERGRPARIAPY